MLAQPPNLGDMLIANFRPDATWMATEDGSVFYKIVDLATLRSWPLQSEVVVYGLKDESLSEAQSE